MLLDSRPFLVNIPTEVPPLLAAVDSSDPSHIMAISHFSSERMTASKSKQLTPPNNPPKGLRGIDPELYEAERHVSTITKKRVRVYKCDVGNCDHTFSRTWNLKQHLLVHDRR